MSDLQDALGSPIAMAQAFMVGFQLRGEAESWPESTMTEIANVIETLEFQVDAARRVANMKTQERTVMGQDDDGTPNGEDYSERRLVSEWQAKESAA